MWIVAPVVDAAVDVVPVVGAAVDVVSVIGGCWWIVAPVVKFLQLYFASIFDTCNSNFKVCNSTLRRLQLQL